MPSTWYRRLVQHLIPTVPQPVRRSELRYRPQLVALEERVAPATALLSSFAGLDFTQSGGSVPPDTSMAVGPNHVVEVVNTTLAIFNKTSGAKVSQRSFDSFFAPVSPGPFLFDPVVTFDELANRFVIVILDVNDADQSAFIDLAVSNGADPTLGFTEMHKIDVKEFSSTQNRNLWSDYPKLGWNADAYVVSVNMFSFPTSTGNFDHVQIVSIDKSAVLDAKPSTLSVFRTDRSNDFTMVPATMHGSQPGDPMWFVEDGDGSNTLAVRMTNVLTATPSFADFTLPVAAYTQPPPGIQPGSGRLETGDTRMLSGDFRDNRLVAAQSVGVAANNQAHVRWYEINTAGTTPQLAQQGTLSPGSGVHTWFPAIALSTDGTIGITYVESSPTEFLSMYVALQTSTDMRGTFEPPVRVRAGQATYNAFDGSPFRTGDYSGIGIDPVAGTTFWAANEFATSATRNNWGTFIANFGTSRVNQRFVAQLFLDLFGRPVDAGSQNQLAAFLDNGLSRTQLVRILENSLEYHMVQVQGLFHQYLQRDADSGGLTFFANILNNGGTVEQVAAILTGSAEYFMNQSGATNDGFLDKLYRDVFNRSIDMPALMAFRQALNNGLSRTQVATILLSTLEYHQNLVSGLFPQFLRRAADTGGLSFFAGILQLGMRDEDAIAILVGSDEYFSRV